ncbi:hypothetical protein KM043_010693 [Ampulex compressa]|nr:hypothetical protein KM043_010693 [Ampulex compressa]
MDNSFIMRKGDTWSSRPLESGPFVKGKPAGRVALVEEEEEERGQLNHRTFVAGKTEARNSQQEQVGRQTANSWARCRNGPVQSTQGAVAANVCRNSAAGTLRGPLSMNFPLGHVDLYVNVLTENWFTGSATVERFGLICLVLLRKVSRDYVDADANTGGSNTCSDLPDDERLCRFETLSSYGSARGRGPAWSRQPTATPAKFNYTALNYSP